MSRRINSSGFSSKISLSDSEMFSQLFKSKTSKDHRRRGGEWARHTAELNVGDDNFLADALQDVGTVKHGAALVVHQGVADKFHRIEGQL